MQYRSCPAEGWELAGALPHPQLRPGVYSYRGFRLTLGRPRRRLELPTGEVTLVLGLDHRITISDPSAARSADACNGGSRSFTSMLSGPRTRASVGEHNGKVHGLEVLMAPWAAYRLFGAPMHELAGEAVELDALLGRRAAALTGAVAGALGWAQRFAILDAELCRLHEAGPVPARQVLWAWGELTRTAGRVPIQRLAARTGWSWRQLDSRFQEQIGLGPKAVARVLRLRRALQLITLGRPPAGAASACGFYDQAHLNREFRAMTGLTPGQFLIQRTADRPGPPAVDRLSGEITSVVLSSPPAPTF